MAVTGQTYAERANAVAPVSSLPNGGASRVRVDEDLMTADDFAAAIAALIGTVIANAINNATATGAPALRAYSTQDNAAALVAQSSDTSPATPPFAVLRSDDEILGSIHASWVAGAIGYINALNVFDSRVWVTTDQTEPAGASNGQYWIRPRVA